MIQATSPVYSTPDNSAIDVLLDHPVLGPIPFTAARNDPSHFCREVFERAENGEFGPIAAYVPRRTWPDARA